MAKVSAAHQAVTCEFGRRLYQKLQARGYNQAEFARVVGVGRDRVNRWVKGRERPHNETIKKISDVLNCNVEDILPTSVQADVPSALTPTEAS